MIRQKTQRHSIEKPPPALGTLDPPEQRRVSCIITTVVRYHERAEFVQGDGTPRFNPFFIPKMIGDIAAGHISMEFGFRGPNYACVSACASATSG